MSSVLDDPRALVILPTILFWLLFGLVVARGFFLSDHGIPNHMDLDLPVCCDAGHVVQTFRLHRTRRMLFDRVKYTTKPPV